MTRGMHIRGATLLVVLAMAAGCGSEPDRQGATGAAPTTVDASTVASADANDDLATLQARIQAALREQRIHTSGGAIELYLSLQARLQGDNADDGQVRAALDELQPYLLIATEQAVARGDLAEGKRLMALLARMNPDAPALPRLGDALLQAERDAARHLAQVQAEAEAQEKALAQALAQAKTQARKSTSPSLSRSTASARPASPARSGPEVIAPPTTSMTGTPSSASTLAKARTTPSARTLLRDAAPRYPGAAVNRRIEGHVQVALTILPDGSVADARVVSATPAGIFEEATLAAARRWRFSSGQGSVPLVRTVQFQLTD